MAGFTGFSFSNSSFPAFPPFAATSASSGSTHSSSSSTTNSFNSGSTPTPSFGSSSAPTDEATIKKIVEAIEILEKLAKNGVFPQEKLEEIKKELGKMYPNLFNKKTQNNSQGNNPQKPAGSYFPYSFTSSYANSNMFQQQLQQQQQQQEEFIKQYTLMFQQQLNHDIQAQTQLAQQEFIKNYQTAAAEFRPYNIYGNYPSYNNYQSIYNGQTSGDALNTVLGMMGQSNNSGGLMSNILGSTGLGSDGFNSLSFLGSLLGGFGM